MSKSLAKFMGSSSEFWINLLGFFFFSVRREQENNGVIREQNPAWLLCRLGKVWQSGLVLSFSGLWQRLDVVRDLFFEY